jgi:hypothetical protein
VGAPQLELRLKGETAAVVMLFPQQVLGAMGIPDSMVEMGLQVLPKSYALAVAEVAAVQMDRPELRVLRGQAGSEKNQALPGPRVVMAAAAAGHQSAQVERGVLAGAATAR